MDEGFAEVPGQTYKHDETDPLESVPSLPQYSQNSFSGAGFRPESYEHDLDENQIEQKDGQEKRPVQIVQVGRDKPPQIRKNDGEGNRRRDEQRTDGF